MLHNNLKISGNTPSAFTERRLDRAAKHVNELWFPPNPTLLNRIKQGLENGVYDLDIDFLFHEIKTDFALLTYCLRETTNALKEEGISIPEQASFSKIFELAGLKRLHKILNVEIERISSHNLEDTSEEQALRLQGAMISASVVEVMAGNYNLDPDLGFSYALMRQLGHTLIAWNYPSVYQRCLAGVRQNKELDSLLTEALGFSPMLLAMTLATQWGLEKQMISILDSSNEIPLDSHVKVSHFSDSLKKLCEVGEALARANDPEHYPEAEKDWELAKNAVENSIGIEGIRLIQDRVKQNCESYLQLMPEMFSACLSLQPEAHIHDFIENSLLKNNQFVKHCPPRLRKRLKDLYSALVPGKISNPALQCLIKEIIPFAGFNGGYIYTLDPAAMLLVPRTKIGTLISRKMEPVKYDTGGLNPDPIAVAFGCNAPLVHNDENASDLNFSSSHIVGIIGNQKKVGVLYLELPSEALREADNNMLLHFKAIRQALNDCLQI